MCSLYVVLNKLSPDLHNRNGEVVKCLPWNDYEIEMDGETSLIKDRLIELNKKGILTINSQPNANAVSSDDKVGIVVVVVAVSVAVPFAVFVLQVLNQPRSIRELLITFLHLPSTPSHHTTSHPTHPNTNPIPIQLPTPLDPRLGRQERVHLPKGLFGILHFPATRAKVARDSSQVPFGELSRRQPRRKLRHD